VNVIIQKNLKNLEDYLPFIEFAYNRSVHSMTEFLPFEIVYGFNPLTPMDLIPLLIDERVHLDGNHKAQVVKTLSMRVYGNRLQRGNVCIRTKPIRGPNMLSFSLAIGFGCMCARRDFRPKPIRSANMLSYKPYLLGFLGIDVFACGLRDHVIMRFISFGIRAWLH